MLLNPNTLGSLALIAAVMLFCSAGLCVGNSI